MSRLVRYDPYNPFSNIERMMSRMQAMTRGSLWPFDDAMIQPMDANPLEIDMVSNDGDIIVRTALPGVNGDEVHVDVQGNVLTISAETKSARQDQNENWHIREMRYGKFSRSVALPEGVKVDKADARLENGILTVTLPKEKPSPVQNVVVKAKKLLSGNKA